MKSVSDISKLQTVQEPQFLPGLLQQRIKFQEQKQGMFNWFDPTGQTAFGDFEGKTDA